MHLRSPNWPRFLERGLIEARFVTPVYERRDRRSQRAKRAMACVIAVNKQPSAALRDGSASLPASALRSLWRISHRSRSGPSQAVNAVPTKSPMARHLPRDWAGEAAKCVICPDIRQPIRSIA